MKVLRLPFVLAVALAALLGTLASPASAVERTCYGKTGDFNDQPLLLVDWNRGVSECFGVAPSGSIWHTWQTANTWYEMPGNGRAWYAASGYDIYDGIFPETSQNIGKAVKVVSSTSNSYCNYLDYATNTWGGWYQVPSSSTCTSAPNYGYAAPSWLLQ
ncbi:hypothetical protein [Streptomyces sp. GESEQ-35]|uniref:hypothetical protein n=1 Tax=Streptomyces sp. GESEQ-35 TaxID=2812657 RepID=UPI001B321DA1|nr:hypothetical protein [Streptomyces sp. GESEQ-35]